MSRRTRIAKGIYRDKSGIAIVVSVRGTPREFRKNEQGQSYKGWERARLIVERKRIDAREYLKAERAAAHADTVAQDVQTYLLTIQSPSHRRNAAGYLAHWVDAFGDRQRDSLTDVEIKTRFAEIDKAPSTRNHIRRELFVFYQTMNGRDGYNPARHLRAVREKYRDARALSYDIIEAILKALHPSPSKARLAVMAYTGLPQSLIAKLRPSDLHLDRATLYVRPRRKGAGVEGRELPLSPAGVAALTTFRDLGAFGSFQNRQLVNALNHGIEASGVTVPDGTRPYDLRHSFLTEVYRQTGDLKAVSELGMHATLEQTARYAQGAVSERATKALAAVPRFFTTRPPAKRGKLRESKGTRIQSSQRRKPPRKR